MLVGVVYMFISIVGVSVGVAVGVVYMLISIDGVSVGVAVIDDMDSGVWVGVLVDVLVGI